MNSGFYQAGDYVVPEYGEQGNKTAPGQVIGSASEVMDMSKRMAQHALMQGASPLPIAIQDMPPARKGPKAKAAKPEKVKKSQTAQERLDTVVPLLRVDGLSMAEPKPQVNLLLSSSPQAPASSPIEVVFSTQLGRIKVNASAVLDSNNALVIVFSDEGEIRYEPAPGSEVQLLIGGRVENTMYPGFKFSWVDDKRKLMVFVKLPDAG